MKDTFTVQMPDGRLEEFSIPLSVASIRGCAYNGLTGEASADGEWPQAASNFYKMVERENEQRESGHKDK